MSKHTIDTRKAGKYQQTFYKKLFPMDFKFLDSDFWQGVATAALAWLSSIYADVSPFIWMVAGLVILDLITGVLAAKKQGVAMHSRGLQRSIEKIVSYSAAILGTYSIGWLMPGLDEFVHLVAILICFTEFKSLIENVEIVTGAQLWSAISEKVTKAMSSKKKKD